jgi:hypothetical protein
MADHFFFMLSRNEDGHTDWFLPATNQSNLILTNDNTAGGDPLNFTAANNWHWASTEYDQNNARVWSPANGINAGNKTTTGWYVRCMRE